MFFKNLEKLFLEIFYRINENLKMMIGEILVSFFSGMLFNSLGKR